MTQCSGARTDEAGEVSQGSRAKAEAGRVGVESCLTKKLVWNDIIHRAFSSTIRYLALDFAVQRRMERRRKRRWPERVP